MTVNSQRIRPTTMQLHMCIICLQLAILWGLWLGVDASKWATPSEEAQDEVNDAIIFRNVLRSVDQWMRKRRSHRYKREDRGICYPEVGCFHTTGIFSISMLPSKPEDVGTRFLLFNTPRGRGRSNGPLMDVPFTNLSNAWKEPQAFNASAPTKVIVHGLGSNCKHVWVYEMRNALMDVENCNVICVDWEAGAAVINYVQAAANTQIVGRQLAILLAGLNKNLGMPFHKVHLIGFSLGAHVAGFAGAEIKNLSRITGLDPAGPLFESQDPRVRLDPTDAVFVDVIHSNGETLMLGGLGAWQQMGHVDFYPNGGRMQKGCHNLFMGALRDVLWGSEEQSRSLCNHRRAYKFFIESVIPRCHFPAFPCETWDNFLEGKCFSCAGERGCGNMGYYADRAPGRGALFLITREEEPFCAHQYHVRLESSATNPPTISYGSITLTFIGHQDLNETLSLTQSNDEKLTAGEPLSRILVPHPLLQEPSKVQLLYTAYTGWVTSGLQTWSVLKLMLTDSFGKSLSVCKKGLVLESEVPVTLPLYPGVCNPPRGTNGTSTNTKESESKHDELQKTNVVDKINGTRYIPTPVIRIGDEGLDSDNDSNPTLHSDLTGHSRLDWQPLDFRESSGNSLDDSRSFGNPDLATASTNINTSTATDVPKYTSNITEDVPLRPEIKEPVLVTHEGITMATSRQGDNSSKPEIREPVLSRKTTLGTSTALVLSGDQSTPRPSAVRTREISPTSIGNLEDDRRIWIPSLELNPPPLGAAQTWQNWNLAKNGGNIDKSKTSLVPKATKRSQPSLTIQLLPQRLAAFLAQAERYARLTFMPFPSTAVSLSEPSSENTESGKGSKAESEDQPNQRKPKHFTTVRPPQKPLMYYDHQQNSASVLQPRMDSVHVLVPFSYSYKKKDTEYIPVHFPVREHGSKSDIITIAPDDIKKSFRSVKLDRSTSENPLWQAVSEDFRPIYPRNRDR